MQAWYIMPDRTCITVRAEAPREPLGIEAFSVTRIDVGPQGAEYPGKFDWKPVCSPNSLNLAGFGRQHITDATDYGQSSPIP